MRQYSNIYPTSVPRNCKGTTSNATVTGFELALGTGSGPKGWAVISTATFHPTKAGQEVYAKAIENTFLSFDLVALIWGFKLCIDPEIFQHVRSPFPGSPG